MSTLLSDGTPASTKQVKYIQIGQHNHKMAGDHHEFLSLLKELESRYCTLEQLLFNTSFIGSIHRLLALREMLIQVGDTQRLRKIERSLGKVEPKLSNVEQRAGTAAGRR